MLRKIFLSFFALVLLTFGGLFGLLATNSDIIIDKFHSYVENSTGAPLVSDTRPVFTLLPNRGLELGASTWKKPDGTLSIGFSRASVLISSHALFTGRFVIKNFTVEDLDLTMKLKKPLMDYLNSMPDLMEKRRDLDDIVRIILNTLNLAPDAIFVKRGRICLIEPSGNEIVFDPFTLTANDVHPGSSTDFNLSTGITGTAPAFKSTLDLSCAALFTKNDASFTVNHAKFQPKEGFSFNEALNLSGSTGYDYTKSTLTFSDLNFQGPKIQVSASGGIKSLANFYLDPRKGEAELKIQASGKPGRLAALIGTPLPFVVRDSLSDCSFQTNVLWKNGRLTLKAMQSKIGDLAFSGEVEAGLSPLSLTGSVHFNELRIDSYKSGKSSEKSSDIGQNDFTRWPRVSLQIGADHLYWGKLHLENVSAKTTGQSGTYEMNPLTASLSGSPVTASLKSVMLPTSPLSARIALNFSIPQASLATLSELLTERELLNGKGAVNAALSFTTSRGLPSLSGTGSLSSSGINTSFSVLPPHTPFANLFSTSNRFDRLLVSFTAKDGLMDVERFQLSAPRLSLSGSGKIDLPLKKLDAAGSIRIGGSTVLPVRLLGDVRAPKYSLDMRSNEKNPASIDITLDLDLPKQINKLIGVPR